MSFEEHMSPEEWRAWKARTKRKMPKKGTRITITYTDKEKDMVSRIREFVERHGLDVEFVQR